MKERCPQRIFAKLRFRYGPRKQRSRRLRHREPQGCAAPSVIDLRLTIVVKRFTVNGKFSQTATRFAEDPATFFGRKSGQTKIDPIRSNPVHRSEWQVKPLSDYGGISACYSAFYDLD